MRPVVGWQVLDLNEMLDAELLFLLLKKYEKKEETLTEKMKRSLDERHTQTHEKMYTLF